MRLPRLEKEDFKSLGYGLLSLKREFGLGFALGLSLKDGFLGLEYPEIGELIFKG